LGEAREDWLQLQCQHLQCTEQIGAERDTDGVPATEDHNGESNPANIANMPLRPTKLLIQRERRAADADQCTTERCVEVAGCTNADTPGESRLGSLAHRL